MASEMGVGGGLEGSVEGVGGGSGWMSGASMRLPAMKSSIWLGCGWLEEVYWRMGWKKHCG